MAVYTEVSDTELEAFLADYTLGKLLSYKGIAEADLPFFLSLMEHLATHGLTCPQPVKTRSGQMLGRLAGRPAVIVTFIEGVSSRRPNVKQCAALGGALAQLHAASANSNLSRKNALSIEAWPGLFGAARLRAD